MAKYGIKHDEGKVLAVSIFKDDVVPPGFIEISEGYYIKFYNGILLNPYAIYDPVTGEMDYDYVKLAAAKAKTEKGIVREELRDLSAELDLKTRMGEDTTETQAAFDLKKIEWDNL